MMDELAIKIAFAVLIIGFAVLGAAIVSGCAPDHGPWETSIHKHE